MHDKISKQIDHLFSRITYLTDIKDERNGNTILNSLMRDAYRKSCFYQIKERINHILDDLTSLYTIVASRPVALDVLLQGEAIKEMMNVWDEFFFACAQMKQMSFVYEQQTIIKLYKQARESSRKREKSLRQIQRKLNAELITCSSKTDNDYRQCIKTNRSLFELDTLKCEKSVSAAEKVVVVASGSTRTANGQTTKRCNDDQMIRSKHPSNNNSKIPKLCKPKNNTTVKQRSVNKSAKSFSSFPIAKQGSHKARKCSTAPKKDSEQNLQLQPRAANRKQISKRCNESVNRKHPSKCIIEIPMQYKPGKRHKTAQKSVSTGCNTDVIREDTSNINATVEKNNGKNESIVTRDRSKNDVIIIEDNDSNMTIVKREKSKNDVIIIEDNDSNKTVVRENTVNNTVIVKGDNSFNKNDRCKQSLFSATDHCYTKCLKLDTVAPKICDNAKTSTEIGIVNDTGTLNSQVELRREGNKLINCLLQQVSEASLKRKRDDDSTKYAPCHLQYPSYNFEAQPKKIRLDHATICDQQNVGCLVKQVSETSLKRKRDDDSTQYAPCHLQYPSYDFETQPKKIRLDHVTICDQQKAGCLLQQVSETSLKRKRDDDSTQYAPCHLQYPSYNFEAQPKEIRLDHATNCDQQKVGCNSQILSNGWVDCKYKQQLTHSHSEFPRPIQNHNAPVVFDVISHLKRMVNDALSSSN
eukprot:Seg406.2 transcript_id=Seg406.2/GoldUCD/mRNA.D3Y31 product="hypothetical protein" protein_id=Seg406.2/GoldUCD/D3Y31